MSPPPISFRPATLADTDFIGDLTETVLRAYAEAVFGTFDSETARLFDPEVTRIIQMDGADIGVVSLEDCGTYFWLKRFYLSPAFQGRGIGTHILRQIKRDAEQACWPVRLSVLAPNPARGLYAREGFVVTRTTPERFFMEWRPPAGSPNDR